MIYTTAVRLTVVAGTAGCPAESRSVESCAASTTLRRKKDKPVKYRTMVPFSRVCVRTSHLRAVSWLQGSSALDWSCYSARRRKIFSHSRYLDRSGRLSTFESSPYRSAVSSRCCSRCSWPGAGTRALSSRQRSSQNPHQTGRSSRIDPLFRKHLH